MHHGKLNKARRGELFACVPVGYVKRPDGGIALDPDEQVREVVRLILAKFAELGSVPKVHAYFVANDVRVGLRAHKGPDKGTLGWQPAAAARGVRDPAPPALRRGLRLRPLPDRSAASSGPGQRRTAAAGGVGLPDPGQGAGVHHLGRSTRRTAAGCGRTTGAAGASRTATGRSPTLLNGRPSAATAAADGGPQRPARPHRAVRLRRRVPGESPAPCARACRPPPWTASIEGLVFRAVEPAALELSLRAAERGRAGPRAAARPLEAEAGAGRVRGGPGEAAYDAVDPENRLVARELERQWEAAVTELRQMEDDYARFCQEQPRPPDGRGTGSGSVGSLAEGPAGVVAGGDDDRGGPAGGRATVDRARRGDAEGRQRGDRGGGALARRRGDAARGRIKGSRRTTDLAGFESLRCRVTELAWPGEDGGADRGGAEPRRAPDASRRAVHTGSRVRRLFVTGGR